MTRKLRAVILAVGALGLNSCGSNGGSADVDSSAQVVNLVLEESVIPTGGATVMDVDFSFDAGRVFDDGRNVALQIKLPNGVSFLEGSSEVDLLGGNDDSVGAQVTPCPVSGESFILVTLDSHDLDLATNPDGNADARLTLTITGTAPSNGIIDARADEMAVFGCGVEFIPEISAAIHVE